MAEELPTFPSAPPARIDLPGGRVLVRASVDRTEALVATINGSLEHLSPWMAWAREPVTTATIGPFLAAAEQLFEARHDFTYSIVDTAGAVIGGAGLHARLGLAGLEIGYWVGVDHIGGGVATDAARALTAGAFGIAGVERVEIHCEETNLRSARVPEKLGYRFDGIIVPTAGPTAGRSTQIWSIRRGERLD